MHELRRFLMSKGLVITGRDKGHLDRLLALADTNKDGVIDIEGKHNQINILLFTCSTREMQLKYSLHNY